MLARVHRRKSLRRVPFPGRRDIDEVDVVPLYQLLVTSVALNKSRRRRLARLFDHSLGTIYLALDDITQRGYLDIGLMQKFRKDACASQSGTYDRHAHLFVLFERHTDHCLVCRLRSVYQVFQTHLAIGC